MYYRNQTVILTTLYDCDSGTNMTSVSESLSTAFNTSLYTQYCCCDPISVYLCAVNVCNACLAYSHTNTCTSHYTSLVTQTHTHYFHVHYTMLTSQSLLLHSFEQKRLLHIWWGVPCPLMIPDDLWYGGHFSDCLKKCSELKLYKDTIKPTPNPTPAISISLLLAHAINLTDHCPWLLIQ